MAHKSSVSVSLSALLNLDLPNVLPSGSCAERKPGLYGANYVGEKLPFSASNAQLLREPVQCHRHCTRHRSWKGPDEHYQTCTFSFHHCAA